MQVNADVDAQGYKQLVAIKDGHPAPNRNRKRCRPLLPVTP